MNAPALPPLRPYALDGALLLFDRDSGWNVRVESPSLSALRRRAPRVIHLGLSSACDLDCPYCHRARGLPTRWTLELALAWLKRFAEAGALEVVFGDGEPLLVPWFTDLVRRLHDETPLAVGFTTHGLHLTRARHDAIRGRYGQLRVSVHAGNRPLERVRALRDWGARFGVNVLVTPRLLDDLDGALEALVDAGCDDVLALSYNGPDPALHLTARDDARLALALDAFRRRHAGRVALKVSTCFGRRLRGLPTHLPPGDCGAGDDFLALDGAWRVRACSFHRGVAPVSSPDEALAWWRRAREAPEPAGVRGCARPDVGAVAAAAREGVTAWRAWASNNSSSFLLVGEFPTTARAARWAAEVTTLYARAEEKPERSMWRLLGHADEGPPAFAIRGRELLFDGGATILQRGRTVVAVRDTSLSNARPIASLLVHRRGRILFYDEGGRRAWPDVVLGVEATTAMLPLLRASLPGGSVAGLGAAWCRAQRWQIESLRAVLASTRAQRVGLGVASRAGLATETLDDALRDPVAPATDDARREVLVLPSSPDIVRTVDAFLRDPEARLDARGWRAPFRLPEVLGAHVVGGAGVVEVRGAVNAPLLCGLDADSWGGSVLDARALRAVLRYDGQGDARALRQAADGAATLARPGTAALREDDPDAPPAVDVALDGLVPLAALVRRQRARQLPVRVALYPERPLARAVGRIVTDAMDRGED